MKSEYNKAYLKQYYIDVLKDRIKDVTVHCDCCNKTLKSWNVYAHKKSRKHKMNLMTEEERVTFLENEKIEKDIKKELTKPERMKRKELNAPVREKKRLLKKLANLENTTNDLKLKLEII
jgi:hypothetical protein